MKDDLEQLLKSLHLRKIAEIFDEESKRADKADLSYQEFVARLLRAQWTNQEAALAWRIKRAGIPEQWTLESFPFKRQPGVKQRQIRTFAELDFVPKAENIVFVPTGVGRTGLASGLLLKLQNGHRGIFMRAQDLSDEMYASTTNRIASSWSTARRASCSAERLEARSSACRSRNCSTRRCAPGCSTSATRRAKRSTPGGLRTTRTPSGVLEVRTGTGRYLRVLDSRTAEHGTVSTIADVTE